ncbi:hypothetical protein [Methanothermobacter sp. K4]|uniref:hypothetical protein n=1 Tax=Methanothermobacter TaxID=145260 RepID=UPI001EDB2D06|nr:hypothetical protein [Methanothermobacter sp. K4]
MNPLIERIKYSIKIAVILAVLGSAVLFIWGMIGRMAVDWNVLRSALEGFVAFGIFGFILGFLIYDLEP